ncbi:hypothetical protein B7463_g4187, partial [Scytalidium lignicola]
MTSVKRKPCRKPRHPTISTWSGVISKIPKRSWPCSRKTAYVTRLPCAGHGSDGCPLHFSAAEIEQQEEDEKLWAQGVELMDTFISDAGGFKHWDGRVSDEDYETLKAQLASGIERFLDREAKNAEERAAWLRALPFVDHE